MLARALIACVGLVLLVAITNVFAKTDHSKLPPDPAELVKAVNESKTDLVTAIQSAQKSAEGKAASAAMTVVDGKLEITVDVVSASGTIKRVKMNPETGKVE